LILKELGVQGSTRLPSIGKSLGGTDGRKFSAAPSRQTVIRGADPQTVILVGEQTLHKITA